VTRRRQKSKLEEQNPRSLPFIRRFWIFDFRVSFTGFLLLSLSLATLAACGGGGGAPPPPQPTNPVPNITSLSPSSATAGGASFTLTVNGANFVSSSVVQWKGTNRSTTFVSATQLQAAISASDIGVAGTAQVTVFSPAPGGGTSNAVAFAISAPPLNITTTQLPATTGDKLYEFTLSSEGGNLPITWSLAAGSGPLPGNLSLDSTGRISGLVASVGSDTTVNFTAQVTDSSSPAQADTQDLSIVVRAAGLGRNDTCTAGSTAGTTVISNGAIRASLSPYGDIDVYSFQGTAGAKVTIETLGQRLGGAPQVIFTDTVVELLDTSCNLLTFNDDIEPGLLDSRIQDFTLPYTGTYYIRVRDFRGDGRPDLIYELLLSGAN